jgi:hypothetical protein
MEIWFNTVIIRIEMFIGNSYMKIEYQELFIISIQNINFDIFYKSEV